MVNTNERTFRVLLNATFKSNLPVKRIMDELQLALVNETGNIIVTDNKDSVAFNVIEYHTCDLEDVGYEDI